MKTETSKANNLTDKEIKKALECCCNSQGCSKCDFSPKCDGFTSVKLALDLINRQEQENEELKCKNSNLTSDLTSLQKDLTSAKAEVERLEKALENQQKISMDRHFEIERLKNHIQEGIDLAKQIPEMLALAKAEAYKEFDELLKDECLSYPLKEDDITMLVDVKSYNNLLNELVGE